MSNSFIFSSTSIQLDQEKPFFLEVGSLALIESFKQIPLTSLEFIDATLNEI
jgi:hypothetical protein